MFPAHLLQFPVQGFKMACALNVGSTGSSAGMLFAAAPALLVSFHEVIGIVFRNATRLIQFTDHFAIRFIALSMAKPGLAFAFTVPCLRGTLGSAEKNRLVLLTERTVATGLAFFALAWRATSRLAPNALSDSACGAMVPSVRHVSARATVLAVFPRTTHFFSAGCLPAAILFLRSATLLFAEKALGSTIEGRLTGIFPLCTFRFLNYSHLFVTA
jgi:hypothetical protein